MKKGYKYYFSKFGNTGTVVDINNERVLVELVSGLQIWVSKNTDFRVV